MKNILVVIYLSLFTMSCASNFEARMFNFDNFKGTVLEELALAVRADDGEKVSRLATALKSRIDETDPHFNQTLLALSVQNRKRNAFYALLSHGASPNKLLGKSDGTPFIYAVENVDDCDLYYVSSMLKFGADPNLGVERSGADKMYGKSYPLLAAIGVRYGEAKECLSLIELLVENNADIKVCNNSDGKFCKGVFTVALLTESLDALKYFIIDKKIEVPEFVLAVGGFDSPVEYLTLEQALTSEDYRMEDFTNETGFHDRSHYRKVKNEILEFLAKRK